MRTKRLQQRQSPVAFRLVVAVGFVTNEARVKFDQRIARPDLAACVKYLGFVSGAQKNQWLREADLFCFPTYYEN